VSPIERTLVVVKPDGVRRGLVGRVISRLEAAGLRVARLERRAPTPDLIEQHYPGTTEWLAAAGGKTIAEYRGRGRDVAADLGTDDPEVIGRIVKAWLVAFMTGGPVVALVMEGPGAVAKVRSLTGGTIPVAALPGTIRGDFGLDSAAAANAASRPVHNLVHASGDPEEANREIALWFGEEAAGPTGG
jgi:nucleoside-diphosphate kinase